MNKGSLLGSAEIYSRCTEEASRRGHCNTRLFAEVQKGRFVLLLHSQMLVLKSA